MSDSPKEEKTDESVVDVAKFAVAAIGVLTAAAGLIGGFTGGIARVARNGPDQLPWAVIMVFIAALLALGATFVPKAPETPQPGEEGALAHQPRHAPDPHTVRSILLVLSLVFFGIAAVIVTATLSRSLSRPDRPVINAEWLHTDGGWALKGTVSATGLKTTDTLTVIVDRRVVTVNAAPTPESMPPSRTPKRAFSPPPYPDHYAFPAGVVYLQQVGADLDGVAKITFQVPLPKDYGGLGISANLNGTSTGCPSVLVPSPSGGPLACLVLDAPTWPAPTSSSPATSSGSGSTKPKEGAG